MSMTLLILPQAEIGFRLKEPVASKLIEAFGEKMDQEALPYLRGLRDGLPDDDTRGAVVKIIDAIQDGTVFDMHEEY